MANAPERARATARNNLLPMARFAPPLPNALRDFASMAYAARIRATIPVWRVPPRKKVKERMELVVPSSPTPIPTMNA